MCSLPLMNCCITDQNSTNKLELNHRQPELQPSALQEVVICVRDACKHYGTKNNPLVVLDKFDMTVPKGIIYGLLGASGCGKTTILSCILGQKNLNSGKIWTLGGAPTTKDSGIPGPRVGYMPQEAALYLDFTIQETFTYFGWIAGMSNKKIEERTEALNKLLSLPDLNQTIRTLSGGEQRRVSLASTLLHEPELLILDEPTVGLDPILRENIWEYLRHICTNEKRTIVLTTHYIEETRQANIVGLMRNGKLLAEESPVKLLNHYRAETLEDVFLKLSLWQSTQTAPACTNQTVNNLLISNSYDPKIFSLLDKQTATTISDYLPAIKYSHMTALIWKNIMWWRQNIISLIFMFLLAILTTVVFCVAIGPDPHDLSVAVVNLESNNTNCGDLKCDSNQLGCVYLKYLKKYSLVLLDYKSEEEARQSVIYGKTYASITIKNNYSDAFHIRIDDWKDAAPWNVEYSTIDVFQDVSSLIVTTYIRIRMYNAYDTFLQDYLESCASNREALKVPLKWKTPVYGTKYPTFTDFAMPGVLLSMTFLMGTVLTSTVMLVERNEASFERTFVMGIKETELLIAHIACECFIMIIQAFFIITFAIWVFDVTNNGSLTLVIFLTISTGVCGLCYGILVSCIYDTYIEINMLVMATFLPTIIFSGIFWPIEGVPQFIQPITSIFPLTKPTEGMRSILQKNWDLSDHIVQLAFISLAVWTIIIFIISIISLKLKKS